MIIIIKTGVVKDFEVVKKVRNVVALEDDFEDPLEDDEWDEWDEWEQIYDTTVTEKKSYSSALKGA